MLAITTMLLSLLLLPLKVSSLTAFNWTNSSCTLMFLTLYSLPQLSTQVYSFMPSSLKALDQISTPLVILTLWLTALMISASSSVMKTKKAPKTFIITVITLTTTLFFAFSTNSLIIFYLMFEASLIPTLFLILKWGYQPERLQAGLYLMMYTVTASLPLLLVISMISVHTNTTSMSVLMPSSPFSFTSLTSLKMCWLLTTMAFMVKMPVYTVHLWLPKAHVEAPIAGSMILAGVLLKLGSYGLLRMMSLFPTIAPLLKSPISALALVGASISSLICLRQTDMKSLIAYSSVGHMGILTAGLITLSPWGVSGAMLMMVAHGLCSSAMFTLANISYEAAKTRSLSLIHGMGSLFPALMMWWFMLSSCNMAAPPSMNLLGEVMLMAAIVPMSPMLLFALAPLSFLAAAYSIILYTTTQHGAPPKTACPSHNLSAASYTTILLHLAPIILLLLKPSIIIIFSHDQLM